MLCCLPELIKHQESSSHKSRLRRDWKMNRQRRTSRRPSLDSVDEEELVVEEEEEVYPYRKLIDYTISNRRRQVGDTKRYVRRSGIDLPKNRTNSVLPSFIYLEKIPYGSLLKQQQEEGAPSDNERIDFLLKVQKRRSSATKIDDFRAGLTKPRSQKSRLFGAFAENGARRSSYTDLKRAWSKGEGMSAMTF